MFQQARRGAPAGLAALALVVLAAACSEEAPEPVEVARPVKMMEIGGAAAGGTREYLGKIRALQQADMAFEVPGKIVEFRFKEGERVEEGDILARLDPRDYQARLDSTKAEFENARVNFQRAQKLFEEGALAALERDRRRTAMETAEATMREAVKAVEDTELRAPFAGVLARKLVEDYENVTAKQPVLILQDDTGLEIRVNIPERDLAGGDRVREIDVDAVTARVKPRVVITSIPDRVFPARLEQIAMIADPTTRTFEATLVIDNPEDANILAGMTAKALIDPVNKGGEQLIPASATFADPSGNPQVWNVDPQSMTVTAIPVELGELTGSDVEVLAGLSQGDLIAISGVHQLRDGMRVSRLER